MTIRTLLDSTTIVCSLFYNGFIIILCFPDTMMWSPVFFILFLAQFPSWSQCEMPWYYELSHLDKNYRDNSLDGSEQGCQENDFSCHLKISSNDLFHESNLKSILQSKGTRSGGGYAHDTVFKLMLNSTLDKSSSITRAYLVFHPSVVFARKIHSRFWPNFRSFEKKLSEHTCITASTVE